MFYALHGCFTALAVVCYRLLVGFVLCFAWLFYCFGSGYVGLPLGGLLVYFYCFAVVCYVVYVFVWSVLLVLSYRV